MWCPAVCALATTALATAAVAIDRATAAVATTVATAVLATPPAPMLPTVPQPSPSMVRARRLEPPVLTARTC